ncbi:recombinase family protein [Bacillus cereus]|nr:recombinase family protein [Bacillus cereus]
MVLCVGQNLDTQVKQLQELGCDVISQEKVSGRNKDNRIEFQKLLETIQADDTIVVTKLDRFDRSTKDVLTAIGKLMITVLNGIAEFEADMIIERRLEGIVMAKSRGVYKGRPKCFVEKHKGLQHMIELYNNREENKLTVNEISEITNVSLATLYRAVKV